MKGSPCKIFVKNPLSECGKLSVIRTALYEEGKSKLEAETRWEEFGGRSDSGAPFPKSECSLLDSGACNAPFSLTRPESKHKKEIIWWTDPWLCSQLVVCWLSLKGQSWIFQDYFSGLFLAFISQSMVFKNAKPKTIQAVWQKFESLVLVCKNRSIELLSNLKQFCMLNITRKTLISGIML